MAEPPGWTRRGPWEDTFTAARAKLAYAWADFLQAVGEAAGWWPIREACQNRAGYLRTIWARPPGVGCQECGGFAEHMFDCTND